MREQINSDFDNLHRYFPQELKRIKARKTSKDAKTISVRKSDNEFIASVMDSRKMMGKYNHDDSSPKSTLPASSPKR